MNKRNLIALLALMLFVGTGWGVLQQRQELARLRAEHDRRSAQFTAPTEDSRPSGVAVGDTTETAADQAGQGSASELLRLRSEVSRLTARRRELSGVTTEADRLRAQAEANATNAPAGRRLPPGYIRKATAQWVGCGTPEATLQSFLWALQNRDFTNVIRVMTPEWAEKLQNQVQQQGNSTEQFFKDAEIVPGLAIHGRQDAQDGSVEVDLEVAPGGERQKLRLQLLNGEWRLAGPF